MANSESFPAIPEQPGQPAIERAVLGYFLEQQTNNPDFMKGLANRLWNDLSSLEKDTLGIAQATFFPDDLEGRQNSLKAQLVIDYIRTESDAFRELDISLADILSPRSEDPEPPAPDAK
ncbi:MAG: hypothetical protein QFB87_03575 [Patescibacteria group bacterium]|nr:hypothetical protein [Patescibacteria group bacterium]